MSRLPLFKFNNRWYVIFFLLLAAFLRTHQLDQLPPALFHDEAYNGLDVLRVLREKSFPIFFEENNGREPLNMYWEVVVASLVGVSPFSLRIASALIGIVTVALFYWCVKLFFGRTISPFWPIFACGLLACSYWHLHFSRLAFRAIFFVPLLILTWGFYWQGLERGRGRHFIFAGCAMGLSLYTYLPARLLPFLVIAWAVLWGSKKENKERRWASWQGTVLCLCVALVVFSPLLVYFLQHPASFIGRSNQVSIFASAQQTTESNLWWRLAEYSWRTIRMFWDRGHDNPVLTLPYRPITDLPLKPLLLCALFASLAQWRNLRLQWVWGSLFTMLLPSILSNEPSHPLRTLGALPFFVLLLTMGGMALERRTTPQIGRTVVMSLLFLSTLVVYRDYFYRWARHPLTHYQFNQGHLLLAKELSRTNRPIFISSALFNHPSTQFYWQMKASQTVQQLAASELPSEEEVIMIYLGGECPPLVDPLLLFKPQTGQHHQLFSVTTSLLNAPVWLESRPTAHVLRNPIGYPALWQRPLTSLFLSEPRQLQLPRLMEVKFSSQWCLIGFDLPTENRQPGTTIPLTLYWENLFPHPPTYTLALTLQTAQSESLNSFSEPVPLPSPAEITRIKQEIAFPLPADLPLPAKYRWKIYLQSAENQTTPPFDAKTINASTDYLMLHHADVPSISEKTTPLSFTVGESAEHPLTQLQGYEITDYGDRWELTLFWHVKNRTPHNYNVFVHLLDAQNQLLAQHDSEPMNSKAPTLTWLEGELIADSHTFNIPISNYRVAVGLYQWQTGLRLPVWDENQQSQPDQIITFTLSP